MTSEMQSAFHYIQEQNQNSDAPNRRVISVANQFQSRMLELQDENSNMLEVAQREGERERDNGIVRCIKGNWSMR